MTTLTKSRSRGAKATRMVRHKTKATKRRVARKGAIKLAKEAVPTRKLVVAGGVGLGAIAAAFAVLRGRRKSSTAGPSYAPPTGPPAAGS